MIYTKEVCKLLVREKGFNAYQIRKIDPQFNTDNFMFLQAMADGFCVKCKNYVSGSFAFQNDSAYYSIVENTQVINGVECPMHLTETPEVGAWVYYEDVRSEGSGMYWNKNEFEFTMLRNNALHSSRENATKCFKARYKLLPEQQEDR